MKKGSFIKKNAMKDAGATAIKFGARQAGMLGGLALDKFVSKQVDKSAKPNENIKKMTGPAMILIGLAAEVFIEDDTIVAVGQGLGTAGTLASAKSFAPDKMQEALGLKGLGAAASSDRSSVEWEQLAEEALNDDAPADSGDGLEGLSAEEIVLNAK